MGSWPFSKHRSLWKSGFFRGFTDWHSHVLPGVDDGVRTMEEALEILTEYERLGIERVWLTPHIMEDTPNTTDSLRDRFAELQAAWHGNVTLRLAAENMLDNLFDERLGANDLLPLGENGDHLLVETSFYTPPMDLLGTLDRIRSRGYHPVLAHPERYMYMNEDYYCSLKGRGVKFQLNLTSLCGLYGPGEKRKAERLLRHGMYDFAGMDLHRRRWLDSVVKLEMDGRLLTLLKNCCNNTKVS